MAAGLIWTFKANLKKRKLTNNILLNVIHSVYDSCVLYWAKLLRGLLEINSKGANDRKEFLGEKLFIIQSLHFMRESSALICFQ